MNEHDKRMLEAVRAFSPHGLYSKSDEVSEITQSRRGGDHANVAVQPNVKCPSGTRIHPFNAELE